MTDDYNKEKAVHSCFSKKYEVSKLPSYFFHPESNIVDKWKSEATICALQLLEDESTDPSGSAYSSTIDEDHILKDEYDQFINALPSCTPLFGHLYNVKKDTTYNWDCFCPCSPLLSGWGVKNKLGFLHLYECQYQSAVKMKVFSGHLKGKSGNKRLVHGRLFDHKKNCFLHTLTLTWMNHFFQHFDLRDKDGLTEYEHELKYNSDNIIVPDSPVLPSHTTDKRSSNDIPMDEGWRSRISRSTQPGKRLYTNAQSWVNFQHCKHMV